MSDLHEHPAAKRMRMEFEAKYGEASNLMCAANRWFDIRTQYNDAWNRDRERPITLEDVEAAEREMLAARAQPAQAGQVPKGMKLFGYYHKAPSGDPHEDDFFFADAINGDCPHCHPCYMDASVVVHPTPAAWKTPMTEADLERITRDPITVREAVRAAERHHGIVGEKGGQHG